MILQDEPEPEPETLRRPGGWQTSSRPRWRRTESRSRCARHALTLLYLNVCEPFNAYIREHADARRLCHGEEGGLGYEQ